MSEKKQEKSRKRRRSRGRARKIMASIIIVLVVLVILLVVGWQVMKAIGKARLRNNAQTAVPQMETQQELTPEEETEGVIYHQGKKYRYKEDVITFLCMGIDSYSNTKTEDEPGRSGQSDANFLLVLDGTDKKIHVIAIPRDTMTEIDIYDYYGNYFSSDTKQLGLQYAYGDGKELSCTSMVKAVSNLMYGLPIHGYVSINMNAIPVLNDAVDGVTVTIPDDTDYCKKSGFEAGEVITLQGNNAKDFVRFRNMKTFASNNLRMARQKQYLISFANAARSAVKQDLTVAVDLYQQLVPYMYTDVTLDEVSYLAGFALDLSFDPEDLVILDGTVEQGEIFEEYYLDEDTLYQLILEVFYQEIA